MISLSFLYDFINFSVYVYIHVYVYGHICRINFNILEYLPAKKP
jgi:hypothetical protein